MPELPEIKHLASTLRPLLVGKRIVGVRCKQPKMLNLPPEEFGQRARGRIVAVLRRGKACVLRLEEGSIWLHLGLGGDVTLGREIDREPQLAIVLDDGEELALDKVFMGHAHYHGEEDCARRWAELGIEPLSDDFTLERWQEMLARKSRQSVKALLMDQGLLAGIGNVYSDEILHAAGLRPTRRAGDLRGDDAARLYGAIRRVLAEAGAAGGADDYADPLGRRGRYDMRVHGVEACRDCGAPVHRVSIGGRTAYYCPVCQAA